MATNIFINRINRQVAGGDSASGYLLDTFALPIPKYPQRTHTMVVE